MKAVILRLEVPGELTFEQLIESRQSGNTFVVYEYLFPRPLFPPVKRISRLYYIHSGEKLSKYAFRYNLMTLIWGWWGLPFGPFYTFATLKHNKTGTDFTEDVLDNLTKEDFTKKIVTIHKISAVFIAPDKSSLKEFTKCLTAFARKEKFESNPVVGKYIDTDTPYYIIGLSANDYLKKEDIKKSLYTYFYSHIPFAFINTSEKTEMGEKLLRQGSVIICP
jgi:hypothetical protein